ncbi:hypothetical protein [Kordiimonas sp.]|uniref:hypothetical protein n=1 Tax=Kordiimonas sp. TaxID=1970157 RepID=UPI003A8F35E3
MSERNRGDRTAIVALSLFAVWLLIIAGFGLWSRSNLDEQIRQRTEYYERHRDNPEVAQIVAAISDFDPTKDTYAQWLMAAFAAIATGASIWALVYLRRTLYETRRIGKAQIRAYLTCTGGKFTISLNAAWATVTLKNTGQSPATRCAVRGHLMTPNMNSVGIADQLSRSQSVNREAFYIAANIEGDVSLIFDLRHAPREMFRDVTVKDFPFAAHCELEWFDVFGDRQYFEFFVVEDDFDMVTRDETSPRNGTFSASNTAPTQERQ